MASLWYTSRSDSEIFLSGIHAPGGSVVRGVGVAVVPMGRGQMGVNDRVFLVESCE